MLIELGKETFVCSKQNECYRTLEYDWKAVRKRPANLYTPVWLIIFMSDTPNRK